MAPQSDEANLARIRDNQRRSRARRKEYQQELEQRVRVFEELGVEASTEVQQAARRVADENRKLRALLQSSGISHASIEAYLQTGDVSAAMTTTTAAAAAAAAAATPAAAHASALDHLMVARFPAHYVSPLPSSGGGSGSGALSVSGSVGPSSPTGGSVGGGDGGAGGGGEWEASIARDVGVMATHSSTSSPPVAMRSIANRASGSHRSSHRSSFDSKGKRHVSSAMMPTGDFTASGSSSSAAVTATTTSTNTSTATNSDYLTGYGLSNAFYGLDGASTEELPYTANEPQFFDYSASPHYYGGAGGAGNGSGGSAMSGTSQAPGAPAYYSHVPILPSSSGGACPACLSGMGCQVHSFFEE